MNMGGDYAGVVEDPNKIVKCKIDMCKQPTKFSYENYPVRSSNQEILVGHYTEMILYQMKMITNPKCTNVHNEAVVEGIFVKYQLILQSGSRRCRIKCIFM